MRTAKTTVWFLAALLLAAGCEKIEWKWPGRRTAKPEPETQPAAATQPAEPAVTQEELRQQVQTLKAQNSALKLRIDELRIREQILSDRLQQLDFEYNLQIQQIAALAKAPAERDRYKQQAEKLAIRVARLEATLDRLLGREPVAPPGPTTKPLPVPAKPETKKKPPTTPPAAGEPTTMPAGSSRPGPGAGRGAPG